MQKLNVLQLFDDNDSYFKLSKSLHGNCIIQKLIEKNQTYSNLMIYNEFRNEFICNIFMDGKKLKELSINKHGSAVIETCVKIATKEQIDKFVETVCNNDAFILSEILPDKYGNCVANTLLWTCTDLNYGTEAQCIIDSVNKHIINLARFKQYGESYEYLVERKLQRCFPFIKHCCQWYFT